MSWLSFGPFTMCKRSATLTLKIGIKYGRSLSNNEVQRFIHPSKIRPCARFHGAYVVYRLGFGFIINAIGCLVLRSPIDVTKIAANVFMRRPIEDDGNNMIINYSCFLSANSFAYYINTSTFYVTFFKLRISDNAVFYLFIDC